MKVLFMSHHYKSPSVLLDTILKMTPRGEGKWKDMEATLNEKEADYFIALDGISTIPSAPPERTIFFGQHPKVAQHSPSFKSLENVQGLAKFPMDKFWNPGEWWLNLSFDEINELKSTDVIKKKNLCCIMTYQTRIPMYEQRIRFMEKCVQKCTDLDLYGRPEENFRGNPSFEKAYRGVLGNNKYNPYLGEHLVGKDKVGDYRYSLEYDVGPTSNYISERFYDALFMWTMPLYFGSNNVHDILPSNSFHYIDIYNDSDIEKIEQISKGNSREENIEAIAEARNLLLTKYQLWAYVWEKIKSL